MISARCFVSWIREAGRSHLAAALGWGSFILYGVLAVTRLSFDTQNSFFGIGGPVLELRWLCMGLGILFAFLEFFYLFRRKQQDFYYSLPVSRRVIFWSRYVHGLFHVTVPLLLVMSVCGLYQTAIDRQFGLYAGSYTLKSIIVYEISFLLFYHIGILSAVVCGNIIAAITVCGALIIYFPILTGNICISLCRNYFLTFYKNELIERLYILLSPERLTADLTGMNIFEKPLVLSFSPQISSVAAALLWILFSFFVFAIAQSKRKTEMTGRIFTMTAAERTVQIMASFLAGIWVFSFISDFREEASSGIGNLPGCAAGAAAAAAGIHLLLEYAVQGNGSNVFRKKYQLFLTVGTVLAAGFMFPLSASAYDSRFPENAQAIGISIDGVGMDYSTYQEVSGNSEAYATAGQMNQYRMKKEGCAAALEWLQEVIAETADSDPTENICTRVKVCCEMPDGEVFYRCYSLTEDLVGGFSQVYETGEYKQAAYPAVVLQDVSEDRFTWNDGVKEINLRITGEQKETILNAYRKDVSDLRMQQLEEQLPCGIVQIRSSLDGISTEMPVYPFFERTCSLLKKYEINIEKNLENYEVDTIKVMQSYSVSDNAGLVSGGTYVSYYEEKDEIAVYKKKLIPEKLDIQPVLYPTDHSADIDVSVTDEETNSIIHVNCVRQKSE